MHPSLRLFSATQFRPVFKKGFFALKTSLVCNEKKPSFECKEALFLNLLLSGKKIEKVVRFFYQANCMAFKVCSGFRIEEVWSKRELVEVIGS